MFKYTFCYFMFVITTYVVRCQLGLACCLEFFRPIYKLHNIYTCSYTLVLHVKYIRYQTYLLPCSGLRSAHFLNVCCCHCGCVL
uniref:Putative secreted protein n=1 Tax=Amblyomma triste TaxID=251400 RepID=A0A023G3P1_AMBTT